MSPGEEAEMNLLHLFRHAKSSAQPDLEDHERRLSRRGRETARRVGKYLLVQLGAVDLVLCSSARRTRETLDLLLAELAARPRILIEDELYLASREKLTRRLRRLDGHDTNVLVIGHNPGLRDLAVTLADESSPSFQALAASKFPTAACASFLVLADWSALSSSRHELTAYLTPDTLPDEED
jgi:phosphohistidine phosphatase